MGHILFKLFTASFIWKTCQDTHEVFKMFKLKKLQKYYFGEIPWPMAETLFHLCLPSIPSGWQCAEDQWHRRSLGTSFEVTGSRHGPLGGISRGTVPVSALLTGGLKKGMLESLIIDNGPWVDQILCSVKVYVRYIGHQLINFRLVSFGWGGSR